MDNAELQHSKKTAKLTHIIKGNGNEDELPKAPDIGQEEENNRNKYIRSDIDSQEIKHVVNRVESIEGQT
eukprot:205072-Heterocapsa_arctica.AAC.1